MKKFLYIFFISLFFFSCVNPDGIKKEYVIVDAPAEIASRAYGFAEIYKDTDTVYEFGAQDHCRAVAIDCSGLVIMCYKYAMVDTKYMLLVSDMTADYMYRYASTHVSMENPERLRRGDLLFMGEEESTKITHIALFDKLEDGNIYFIDSTQKDTDGDEIDDINGVTNRYYPEGDKRFKGFGRMKLKY